MPPVTPEQYERLRDAVEEKYRACPNCGEPRYSMLPFLMALHLAPGEFRHVDPTKAAQLEDPDEPPLVQVVPVFCGCGHVALFSVAQLLRGETPGVADLKAL